jgi:hypothetical protein
MRVFNFTLFENSTSSLVGVFDIELRSGLILRACSLNFRDKRYWVAVPATRSRDVVGFADSRVRDRFQREATAAAISAMRKAERAA